MSVTRWKCRTCGAEIRGAADSPERTVAQLNHARSAGHRAALVPWTGARPGGEPHAGLREGGGFGWSGMSGGKKAAIIAGALLVLSVLLSLGINGSSDDPAPAETGPGVELRDPGYTDSLCEGSDYARYDDCR